MSQASTATHQSFDDLRVSAVLREGPQGRVERVTAMPQGRTYIRKIVAPQFADLGVWSQIAQLECDRLPRIPYLALLASGSVEVIMQDVPGRTAAALVEERGPMSPGQASRVVQDVCEALEALHAVQPIPLVHRDVTPSNVLVDAAGRAVLVDFGIARFARAAHERAAGVEPGAGAQPRDTRVLGTRGFSAPEQFGFAQTDARSDVYSAGCLLGYLLTGLAPDDPSYLEALADPARVPRQFREVVARATEFEPSRRFQTARELADAVSRAERSASRRRVPIAPRKSAPAPSPTARRSVPDPDPDLASFEPTYVERMPYPLRLALIAFFVAWAGMGLLLAYIGLEQNLSYVDFGAADGEPRISSYEARQLLITLRIVSLVLIAGPYVSFCAIRALRGSQTHRVKGSSGPYLMRVLVAVVAWFLFAVFSLRFL